jgi:hypothetical protein
MKKLCLAVVMVATTMMPLAMQVQAQPGGGGGGGMRGMRNSPKGRLGRLISNMGDLEKGGKAPLTSAQAKTVVTTLRPWSAKPRMTDAEAKALYMKLNGVLTTKQRNELDKEAAKERRFGGRSGGQGGAGGGRPGGGGAGGPGGAAPNMQQMRQTMQKMQGFMKTYNPLYPPTKYKELNSLPERMQGGFKRRYQAQQALLSQLAKKAK